MINKEDFIDSLKSAKKSWMNKSRNEIVCLLGNNIAIMQGFDQQNPHHCFDLFVHSLTTVDNIEYRENYLLLVAAFLHDIGKPSVAKKKKDRLVFYGHAMKSAEIAKNILRKMNFSDGDIELIIFYIIHHDDFISYILPEEVTDSTNEHQIVINKENIDKYIDRLVKQNHNFFNKYNVMDILENVLDLCVADVKSQAPKVYMNNILVDSMEHKLLKLKRIRKLIERK